MADVANRVTGPANPDTTKPKVKKARTGPPKPLSHAWPVVPEDQVPAGFTQLPRTLRTARSAMILAIRLCKVLEMDPASVCVAHSAFLGKHRVYVKW